MKEKVVTFFRAFSSKFRSALSKLFMSLKASKPVTAWNEYFGQRNLLQHLFVVEIIMFNVFLLVCGHKFCTHEDLMPLALPSAFICIFCMEVVGRRYKIWLDIPETEEEEAEEIESEENRLA